MKQAVIRKILTGSWAEFRFPERGKKYYVKNFTDGDIFVSFATDESEKTAFKVKSKMGEELQMSFANHPWPFGLVYSIWVKGTGEVEVQSEDILVDDSWEGE